MWNQYNLKDKRKTIALCTIRPASLRKISLRRGEDGGENKLWLVEIYVYVVGLSRQECMECYYTNHWATHRYNTLHSWTVKPKSLKFSVVKLFIMLFQKQLTPFSIIIRLEDHPDWIVLFIFLSTILRSPPWLCIDWENGERRQEIQ